MRRYLAQIGFAPRPGKGPRRPGASLLRRVPGPDRARGDQHRKSPRGHIEDCDPWLAARPGQNEPRLTRRPSSAGSTRQELTWAGIGEVFNATTARRYRQKP